MIQSNDAGIVLEAAIVGSYKAVMHLLFRGSRAQYPITISMRAIVRAWAVSSKAVTGDCTAISPHTPLWKNPQLPHFLPILTRSFGSNLVSRRLEM